MYFIFIALIIRGVFEIVGVASIMPFMAVVSNSDVIQTNQFLKWAYTFFSFETSRHFLLALGLFAFLALVFNNLLAALTDWFLIKFIHMRGHVLAQRLLAGYLKKPYSWFLSRNTADMGANILNEVANYMKGVLRPFIEMLARSIVSLFIMGLLIKVDPFLALVVSLTLGGAYGVIFYFVRKRLTRAGKDRVYDSRRQFKYINESLTGIKDIKVLGREKYFFDSFSKHSYRANYNQAIYQIVSQLPRYALEMVAFGGILLIVLYFIALRQNTDNIIPLIALYAFAGYRLMPALQGVFGGLTSLKFNIPVLHRILDALENDVQNENIMDEWQGGEGPILNLSDTIEMNDIEYTYPEGERKVLDGLDLTISANTTVGLVGTTGAGKTTLVDILLGLFQPDKGSLTIDGIPLKEENCRHWRNNVGYVPQNIFLCDDTVINNIALGVTPENIDFSSVEKAACLADIHDFIMQELPEGYNTVIGERGVRLSGGQRQRLGIARAMYHDPDVIIMDEATSSLDGVTEDNIIKAIHTLSKKKTIIMIAHRLKTLHECDIIHFLNEGKLYASGSYEELFSTCTLFRELAEAGGSTGGKENQL
ncbi:ABC transporter ATP-binding protein [Desulfomarina profundi]|uniref:ABC transporter ATP-binding protein n=2 Tax=Desulfomarina profundi TaxID=2772557 RepID=A0A8D5JNY9_9BACT|nr:ABC transporter ATP-binding protein [Desulfomarina profundi]